MTTSTVPNPPVAPPGARAGWFALLAVTLGALMPGLSTTILSVANGDIAADLGVGLSELQWMTTAYLLGLTGSLVLAGKLGDTFGRRLIFLTGIVGFGAAALVIGLSSSVLVIVAVRAVQGVFGGFLTTNALSLLRANFPEERLPTAIGVFNSVQGLSIALGPVLGGLIVEHLGWRWTMFVNIPLVVVCVALGVTLLREVKLPPSARFDYLGTALLVTGLTAVVYALIEAPIVGWTAPSTLWLLGGALVALVLFVFVERRAADPLVPLSLFSHRSFTAGTILSVLAFFALNGGLFLVSLFWLQIQHVPATTVGIWLLPLGGAMLVSAVTSGRVITRIGDRWALVLGSLLLAIGLISLSLAQVDGGYLQMAVGLALVGTGLGLLVSSTVNVTVGIAPVELAGAAAGVQQTASRFGAALGVAVLGGIMAAVTSSAFGAGLAASDLSEPLADALRPLGSTAVAGGVAPIPDGADEAAARTIQTLTDAAFIEGMHTTMLLASCICVLGALVALAVHRRTAATTTATAQATDH